jgi:hypothetical protein
MQRQATGSIRLPGVTRLPAILAASFLLAKSETAEATPQSGATTPFLLISPSVRVNGMGQAGVALPDEPAGYYNPGAAALSSPEYTVQSRLYLSKVPWLPGLADDLGYGYHAVQATAGGELPALSWKGPASLAAAVYGYRTKMDFGPLDRIGDVGGGAGIPDVSDACNSLGVSLALRSFLEVGVGATTKWVSFGLGETRESTRAHDFGLMAVAPVDGMLERFTGRALALGPHLRPRLDIGYGVAWHNHGAGFVRIGAWPADPLPANRRHGWSGSLAMDWRSDALRLTIGKVTFARETYQPLTEGVQVRSLEDQKRGIEFSILETITFRRGEYDDLDGDIHFRTRGGTIGSDGFFKYVAHHLESAPPGSSLDAFLFVVRHLSISWSWFENDQAWPWEGHSHLGLSFRSRQPIQMPPPR